MKKNKIVKITVGTLIALLVITLMVLLTLSQRVVMNPEGTVGNTAGNLNNSGLFCEYNGTVYFYNSFNGGGLFSMNPDESGLRRLNSLKVRNLLAGGKYLYYFQYGSASPDSTFGQALVMHTFDRCELNGSGSDSLTKDVVVSGQLVDNYLYLLTTANSGISFFKVKIDGSDMVDLADYNINPACAENGIIYYVGTQSDHFLYALNTSNDVSYEVWRGNLWNPVLENDYIYFMDVANKYRLCRYSFTQDIVEVLTNDRVDCFNVGHGYIYYQKNGTDPQLVCMRTDGSEPQTIAQGNYTNINITSRYAYFQEFGDENTLYHSPLGSTGCEVFTAASDAAAK